MTKDYASLGHSLRRVKVGERPQEGGGKKVWHQGEHGIDVVSFVDAQGRVQRQELYLGDEVVVWQAHQPPFTGRVTGEARNTPGISRSELVIPDAQPGRSTVANAVTLLKGNTGEDRYLGHLLGVLESVAQGLAAGDGDGDDSVVTSMAQRAVVTDAVEVTGASRAQKNNTALYVAVGAVVAGLVAGGLFLALASK